MTEHEPSIGQTDEWYTPPELLDALGMSFDLDPCSPGPDHWVPARVVYTEHGLERQWFGRVFVNPPFGGRNGHLPWLEKFIDWGDGVYVARAYTSSAWWHDYIPRVDGVLFPRGKTKFIRPDGSVGKSPGHGVALLGIGEYSCRHLRDSGLGMYWHLAQWVFAE